MASLRFDRRRILSQLAGALAAGGCARSQAASGNWPGAWAGLWRDLPRLRVPAATTSLATTGMPARARARGYVNDAQATAALAAAHPRLCQPSVDGRFWRLAASDDAITVDQGRTGRWRTNDREPIQAAVNYAAALGIRMSIFPAAPILSGWRRAPPPSGTGPQMGTALRFRRIWQRAGCICAGERAGASALFQRRRCPCRRHANHRRRWQPVARQRHLQDIPRAIRAWAAALIWWWKSCGWMAAPPPTASSTGPTPRPTREGWDVSHKGIAVRPDRFNGDLHLIDAKITGFRGELVYAGNHPDGALVLDGVIELAETNAQALNPSGGRVICPGFVKAWNVSVFLKAGAALVICAASFAMCWPLVRALPAG
jgi:hypothetical protein